MKTGARGLAWSTEEPQSLNPVRIAPGLSAVRAGRRAAPQAHPGSGAIVFRKEEVEIENSSRNPATVFCAMTVPGLRGEHHAG